MNTDFPLLLLLNLFNFMWMFFKAVSACVILHLQCNVGLEQNSVLKASHVKVNVVLIIFPLAFIFSHFAVNSTVNVLFPETDFQMFWF